MFDLRDVAAYIAKRVACPRAGFVAEPATRFNAKLTANERRNFLRFLNRHELKRFLVLDDFRR